MSRVVVNVATGQYVRGQERLIETLAKQGEDYFHYRDRIPDHCPPHKERPYAFKAYALKAAHLATGATTLLWCDASILPIAPLYRIWDRIERDGYWISDNGYSNYEWTMTPAYPDLFRPEWDRAKAENRLMSSDRILEDMRTQNRNIKHVVATAFGVSVAHPKGLALMKEYFRLAAETNAFCGPWVNDKGAGVWVSPPDVRGHRHDQTALSVIAWRLGCELTAPPDYFAYGGHQTEKTILLADGAY